MHMTNLIQITCLQLLWFVKFNGSYLSFNLMQTAYENFRKRYEGSSNPYDKGIIGNIREVLFAPLPPSRVDFRAEAMPWWNVEDKMPPLGWPFKSSEHSGKAWVEWLLSWEQQYLPGKIFLRTNTDQEFLQKRYQIASTYKYKLCYSNSMVVQWMEVVQ